VTEQEWLECKEPEKMLEYLREKVSDRKLRLFAVACCYRVWHLMTNARSRRVVETAERFADGDILMDAWIAISEEGEQAFRQSERMADAIKSHAVREGTVACKSEATCHAAAAAYYVGHYPFHTSDLPGNPQTVSSAVSIAFLYEKGVEMGVTLTYSGEENSGPMRTARSTERTKHVPLIRCIFGNPFRPVTLDPAWKTPAVVQLARSPYEERRFEDMPVLADALEEAGCQDAAVLGHCRGPGPHVRGCWVLDLILGKE
jgi:hypothetical protein